MSRWSSRPLASPHELERVRELVRTGWRERPPLSYASPGSIDWWRASFIDEDLTKTITLWHDRDGTVAGWLWSHGEDFDWFADPRLTRGDEIELRRAMLGRHLSGGETERSWAAYATQGTVGEELLVAAGGEPVPERKIVQLNADLASELAPAPALPPGFRIRAVRLPEELDARVEIHRIAFAPSRYTAQKQLALAEPGSVYDPSLDLVVESPDGTIAGYAVGWVDRAASVGEIEPLGVHPDFRGRGLATALTRHLVERFRSAGVRWATICHYESNASAGAAYRRAGLTYGSTDIKYRRNVAPAVAPTVRAEKP